MVSFDDNGKVYIFRPGTVGYLFIARLRVQTLADTIAVKTEHVISIVKLFNHNLFQKVFELYFYNAFNYTRVMI